MDDVPHDWSHGQVWNGKEWEWEKGWADIRIRIIASWTTRSNLAVCCQSSMLPGRVCISIGFEIRFKSICSLSLFPSQISTSERLLENQTILLISWPPISLLLYLSWVPSQVSRRWHRGCRRRHPIPHLASPHRVHLPFLLPLFKLPGQLLQPTQTRHIILMALWVPVLRLTILLCLYATSVLQSSIRDILNYEF